MDPAQPEGELDLSTLAGGGLRSDFHDTKAHLVTYRTRAKSRFAEYFTDGSPSRSRRSARLRSCVNARGIADDSEVVTSLNGGTTYLRGQHYVVNYEAGTLARKPGSPIAGTVNVSFLPSITRSSTFSTWVNSRSRPAAPMPVQVLPTFGWQTQTPSSDPALPGRGALQAQRQRPADLLRAAVALQRRGRETRRRLRQLPGHPRAPASPT